MTDIAPSPVQPRRVSALEKARRKLSLQAKEAREAEEDAIRAGIAPPQGAQGFSQNGQNQVPASAASPTVAGQTSPPSAFSYGERPPSPFKKLFRRASFGRNSLELEGQRPLDEERLRESRDLGDFRDAVRTGSVDPRAEVGLGHAQHAPQQAQRVESTAVMSTHPLTTAPAAVAARPPQRLPPTHPLPQTPDHDEHGTVPPTVTAPGVHAPVQAQTQGQVPHTAPAPMPIPVPAPVPPPPAAAASSPVAPRAGDTIRTEKPLPIPQISTSSPSSYRKPVPELDDLTPTAADKLRTPADNRVLDQRSLPPTPHTPQTPHTPSIGGSSSVSRSPSFTAGTEVLPDSKDASMPRRGDGLAPPSVERRRDQALAVQFPEEAKKAKHHSPARNTANHTSQFLAALARMDLKMEHVAGLAREPTFIAVAVACFALMIMAVGFRFFLWLFALVLAPLAARYLIPYPSREVSEFEYPPQAAKGDAVAWVNHALGTLFPLVSTDVLTPFIDLLEDALAEQVPPIVTSVRISSVSLGIDPVLLTSFKAISDEEWFAAISDPSVNNGHNGRTKHSTASGSAPVPPKKDTANGGTERGHTRNPSALSAQSTHQAGQSMWSTHSSGAATPGSHHSVPSPKIRPVSPGDGQLRDRSLSVSSRMSRMSALSGQSADGGVPLPVQHHAAASALVGSVDPATLEATKQQFKRDRLISQLKRHRNQRPKHHHKADTSAIVTDDECEEEMDLDSDQYVNYEVGFIYRHSRDTGKRGTGIHMIAHFGWGVRGLGGSELPIYLDVGQLRGKLRVRILLSASPPFAREVSFSFVSMPEFDISARPLRAGSFNAMNIPAIKSYVEKSIAKVAGAFVSPLSYTMDVKGLLMGHDYHMRTQAMGVLYIVIHNASNLPRTDTVGSCDPYLSLSFSKFNKPLYSTRTIVGTLDPYWEEEAFILVPSWAITTGEKLRLRVCDSDRFSADDLIGKVELDVAEFVEWSNAHPGQMMNRQDSLQAERAGMRVQGEVEWSLRFHPLWQMPVDELQKRVEAARAKRAHSPIQAPWWLEWLDKYVEVPEWEKKRAEQRKATQDAFTGELMRDELEAEGKPTEEFPAGVLQFHIHQCADLELESLSGTFSTASSRRKSAASGKPALQDVIDRSPADNISPPSAYCEVHINDRFIYRTRTKQLTPVPYFNAVSERFIRDWRVAKIVFVIKDQRDREHDPILGVVSLRVRDVLKDSCQVTAWYPLIGGLGWGRLRISLLFKPVDMHIEQNISSFETVTFDLTSMTTTSDMSHLGEGGRPTTLIIEGEYSRAVLRSSATHVYDSEHDSEDGNHLSAYGLRSLEKLGSREELGTALSTSPEEFGMPPKLQVSTTTTSIASHAEKTPLTPRGRESFSRFRSSMSRRRDTLSRKEVADLPHGGPQPLPESQEVEWRAYHRMLPNVPHDHPVRIAVLYRHSCSLVFSFVVKRRLKKDKVLAIGTLRLNDCEDGKVTVRTIPIFETSSVRDAMQALRQFGEAQKFTGTTGDRLSASLGGKAPLAGYATLSFVLHPGLSRAHARIAKRDLKFRSVYNAWEAVQSSAASPGSDDVHDSDSDCESEDSDSGSGDRGDRSLAHAAAAALDRDNAEYTHRSSHSKALHSGNRGIFQLKLARTGKWAKDKVEAKILGTGGSSLDRRGRGMDMEVEFEGQSRF